MWPNPQETVDLVTFTEEILNGKLNFFDSEYFKRSFSENVQTYGTDVSFEISQFFPIVSFLKCTLMQIWKWANIFIFTWK